MKSMKYLILSLGLLLALPGMSWAQKSEIYQNKAGAIKGYDPVAYFLSGKPVKGSKEFTVNWKDAKWYFSSAKHLALFKANPLKYAPQYGGYCAYGLAKGKLFKIEPDAWAIVDGKLYLNYDEGVQDTWKNDQANFIKKADANWPKVLKN